jgi:SHAQKYF class myb-like DNA-binding protein
MNPKNNKTYPFLRTESQEFEFQATSTLANFHFANHLARVHTPRVEQGIDAILSLKSVTHLAAPSPAPAPAAGAKARKDHVTLGQIAEQIHHRAKSEGKLNGNGTTDDEDDDGLNDPSVCPPGSEHTGRWTRAEHDLFLEALRKYGKEWKKVASMVKTRTVVQTRTHAQKYFQKYAKSTGGFGGSGSSGDEVEVEMNTKKSSSISQTKKRRQAEKDSATTLAASKRQNVGEVIFNASKSKRAAVASPPPGETELEKILPPSYEQFPHPSPVSCGKRKKDELTAAQILASTSTSSAPGSTNGNLLDGMMSMQASTPRTSNLMANVTVPSVLDPSRKRLTAAPVGQHGLTIINPESFKHANNGSLLGQRDGGSSSGSKTPWEVQINELEARIGSSANAWQIYQQDNVTIATPADIKALLDRLRACLKKGSVKEMEEVLRTVTSGESRDRSPAKVAAGAIDAINDAKSAASAGSVSVKQVVGPAGHLQSFDSATTDTSESIASTTDTVTSTGTGVKAESSTTDAMESVTTTTALPSSSSSAGKMKVEEAEDDKSKKIPAVKSVSINDVATNLEEASKFGSVSSADGESEMNVDKGGANFLSLDQMSSDSKDAASKDIENEFVSVIAKAGNPESLPMPQIRLTKINLGKVLNQVSSNGMTILIEAVRMDPEQINEDKMIDFVKVLLAYGASAACADAERNTPLHEAAFRRSEKLGRVLLNNGCPPNAMNSDGETAYHVASKHGNIKFTELLAEFGANCHLRNSQARTALDVAATASTSIATRDDVRRAMLSAEPRLRTLVLYHDECLDHRPRRPSDWEGPDRLQAIMEKINNKTAFPDYELEVSSHFDKAAVELLQRVHSAEYIAFVHTLSKEVQKSEGDASRQVVAFTPQVQKNMMKHPLDDFKDSELCDTSFSAGTLSAARRAAGAVAHAVNHVLLGRYRNAFCVIRPPGHHAGYEGLLKGSKSCGFCIFNNVAAGALHALEAHNCERVAVVDLDIHHGNGTEEIVKRYQNSSRLLFFSVHLHDKDEGGYEFFPGSGQEDDFTNNVINVPLVPLWRKNSPSASSSSQKKPFLNPGRESYREAIQQRLLPALRAFNPSLVLLSTGFDGMAGDVGNVKVTSSGTQEGMNLTAEDFEWITAEILHVADICSNGKVVSVLEGGYGAVKRSKKSSSKKEEGKEKKGLDLRRSKSPDKGADVQMSMNREILASAAKAHLRRLIDPYAPSKETPVELSSLSEPDPASATHEMPKLPPVGSVVVSSSPLTSHKSVKSSPEPPAPKSMSSPLLMSVSSYEGASNGKSSSTNPAPEAEAEAEAVTVPMEMETTSTGVQAYEDVSTSNGTSYGTSNGTGSSSHALPADTNITPTASTVSCSMPKGEPTGEGEPAVPAVPAVAAPSSATHASTIVPVLPSSSQDTTAAPTAPQANEPIADSSEAPDTAELEGLSGLKQNSYSGDVSGSTDGLALAAAEAIDSVDQADGGSDVHIFTQRSFSTMDSKMNDSGGQNGHASGSDGAISDSVDPRG